MGSHTDTANLGRRFGRRKYPAAELLGETRRNGFSTAPAGRERLDARIESPTRKSDRAAARSHSRSTGDRTSGNARAGSRAGARGTPEIGSFMNIVYFDLETQKLFEEVGGRYPSRLLLACAVTWSTARNDFAVYWEQDAPAL